MIIDHINHSSKYHSLSEKFVKVFEFLKSTDLENLDVGIHEINGRELFYIVSEDATRLFTESSLEAHRKYIDLHYIISGNEIIGCAPKAEQKVLKEYDSENDYLLYDGDMSLVKMLPGMFAIFYPDDLHMPGISEDKKTVKKIVMKVKIEP
jgi:YhcH/YjgK/YiaL family protein